MEPNWRLKQYSLKDSFIHLYTTKLCADCTFLVGDKPENQRKFLSHKLVLAIASPVFETMFYGSLPEDTNKPIEIPDIEPESFELLLKHAYFCDLTFESVALAQKVYSAADKYMIEHLKKKCVEHWEKEMTFKNVSEMLLLAKEQGLIEECKNFLRNNTFNVLLPFNLSAVDIHTFSTILDQNQLYVRSEFELFKHLNAYAFFYLQKNSHDEGHDKEKEHFDELRKLVKKIRFLCMSLDEFLSLAISKLLTLKEASAILECVKDRNKIDALYPEGFSRETLHRRYTRSNAFY